MNWNYDEIAATLRAEMSSSHPPIVVLGNYKCDGAVGGGIAFSIVGDHDNRPTDMTNLVVYEKKIINTPVFDESQITCPTNGLNPK